MALWEELAATRNQAGDQLVLRRCGGVFEIRCNGWELMSNRSHHSEEAMARLACSSLSAMSPHILIGGLGMGYTLRAALDSLPETACVTVAELLPEIVAWNCGPLGPLADRPLEDHRVRVEQHDVLEILHDRPDRFDAILLDVDNGPDAVLLRANQRLYSPRGLRLIRTALRPQGVLAVWSADRSIAFERRLNAVGLHWQSVDIPARGQPRDPTHTIYFAARLPGPLLRVARPD